MPTETTANRNSRAADTTSAPERPSVFPVAGIGASDGGIPPFVELLQHLPDEPGLAVVSVVRQEMNDSFLRDVLASATSLPVLRIEDGMLVQPDHVYVAPPGGVVTIAGGRLYLAEDGEERPIDAFFRSLAEDRRDCALGVLLSGADSDGAAGALAIRAEGGINFAQDDSAEHAEMPRAAVHTGAVDRVLPPHEIAAELVNVGRLTGPASAGRLPERELAQAYSLLHAAHNIDFTHYKPATIERRIRRRMALHKAASLAEYLLILRESRTELEQLCSDFLIRVTGFFRDPEVFDALGRDILPPLVVNRTDDNPLRVWVPGCATGEEVYSLAIEILEAAEAAGVHCPVQIFGTDVSEAALERARLGIYPESIASDISEERLRRYFVKVDGSYRVTKVVRDCCIFARQNVVRDPPFSRLDLVSCRNVLIYLNHSLQRKVMSIFHYALRPDGYLLLGSSETIGSFGELFSLLDRKHKIYTARASPGRLPLDFQTADPPLRAERAERSRPDENLSGHVNVFREADRVVLSRLSPAAVLINESGEILQFRGRTSSFLEPPSGAASFDILKMAREGLLADLRAAIHTAFKDDGPVRREGIRVRTNGDYTMADVEVVPFVTAQKQRLAVVFFEEHAPAAKAVKTKRRRDQAEEEENTRGVARLTRELEATREYLQSIIEDQEAMNEELRSANEEIHSSNEELQSANEELETAKEELQSSNEELTTLNEELANRNQELAEVNNDLMNLLAAIDVAVIMLDSQLRIRRFNPGAQKILGLAGNDVGRPLRDLKAALVMEGLEPLIAGVIDDLEVRELEVQDRHGGTYLMRVRPYKTSENRIEGAVMVLLDIDHLRKK